MNLLGFKQKSVNKKRQAKRPKAGAGPDQRRERLGRIGNASQPKILISIKRGSPVSQERQSEEQNNCKKKIKKIDPGSHRNLEREEA